MCLCHVPKSKGLVCISHKPIMKCIRSLNRLDNGRILRVTDAEARLATTGTVLTDDGKFAWRGKPMWEYIPKSEWKAEKDQRK